jgi:curved DNA-binding protein CbpA
MQNRKFDPDKIIDYNADYYTLLGISREDFPKDASTPNSKRKIADLLDQAYRKNAIQCHPDIAGDDEELRGQLENQFKAIIKAHTVLSDSLLRKMYDSGGTYRPRTLEDGTSDWEIDWDKLGNYRKGTTADTIGYGLFAIVCDLIEDLDLIPAFYPAEPYHSYNWDFVILKKSIKSIVRGKIIESQEIPKLAISVVPDEEEVLRLTDRENVATSLPFKIYIYIPRKSIHPLRLEDEKVSGNNQEYLIKGQMKAITYSDIDLLETTQLSVAENYLRNNLSDDIAKYRDGTLEIEQQERDRKAQRSVWMDTEQMKKIDTDLLRAVLQTKYHTFKPDPTKSAFLQSIPD